MKPLPSAYVVITPARNEASNIEDLILRMAAQTIPPLYWVIVNDGSTDETGKIIDDYSEKYHWIKVMHLADRGFRSPAGGVEALVDGFRSVKAEAWDYIVNFDADMSPEPDYFERCLEKFNAQPKLGIGGGKVYHIADRKLVVESHPVFHVRGATKIYRRACWEALGGLMIAACWDSLDEVKANMLGWQTQTFSDIRVLQRRPTGSKEGAWWDSVKNGRGDFICGYHPFFMLLKSANRLVRKPYVVGAVGHLWGFFSAYWQGVPPVNDAALIAYVRQQQLRRIFGMKTIWI